VLGDGKKVLYKNIDRIQYPNKDFLVGSPLIVTMKNGTVFNLYLRSDEKYSDAFEFGRFLNQVSRGIKNTSE